LVESVTRPLPVACSGAIIRNGLVGRVDPGSESLADVQATWEHLGAADPLWAILSAPEKQYNQWNLDEFMATGGPTIEALLRLLDEFGLTVNRARALDFGCGVGRLSQPLAEQFERVAGVDISDSMIRFARRVNRHGDRVLYHHNPAPDLHLFADNAFDLVFSNITLQHVPPRISLPYIAEFVRVVKPDGVVVFQLPSHIEAPRARLRHSMETRAPGLLRLYRTVWRRTTNPSPYSMYAVPWRRVEAHVRRSGGLVVKRERDFLAPPWVGFRYFVRKDGTAQ